MSTTDEITDSTDWLPTPLSSVAQIEASLRCQVCKDFFTTPMITSCSHTFCSLCIRRYLSQEGKCPACREQDQEVKLRRNWIVEELVTNFAQSRDGLLRFARSAAQKDEGVEEESERPKKRRKVAAGSMVNAAERRSTRSQSKRVAPSVSQRSVPSTQEEIPGSDDEGSVYEDGPAPDPNDGLVGCPSCSRRMKEALINTHLDKCLFGNVTPPPASSPPPHVSAGTIAYTQTKPAAAANNRLPTINYSLLNETKLRAKLKELGIPNHGSKELMRKRHTEWVNLWNANCDSLRQVSKRDLLRSLDTWERTLGRQVERGKEATGVMLKDFDRDGYRQNQKSNFDDLITQARAKRGSANVETQQEEEKTPMSKENVTDEATSDAGLLSEALVEIAENSNEPIVIEESPVKASHLGVPRLQETVLPLGVQPDPERDAMRPMTARLLPEEMRQLMP